LTIGGTIGTAEKPTEIAAGAARLALTFTAAQTSPLIAASRLTAAPAALLLAALLLAALLV
jgi:hypothetical protein